MKIENKKTVILTIIAVLALLISVVGATYAYFTVNTDNTFGTPKVEAITGALGNVKLVSTENNLYLNLSREDMMKENRDYYYAVTDPNGSPIGPSNGRGLEDILEKFQNGEFASEEEAYAELYSQIMPTIGYIEVDGTEIYDCDYTFEITIEGNMKEALTEGDTNALVFDLAMFDGEPDYLYFTNYILNHHYNIYNTEFPLEISGTLYDISSANKVYISAYLYLNTQYEQNHLIDKNMKLNIKAKSLSCTASKPFDGGDIDELTTYALSNDDLWDMTEEVGIDVMDVQEYRYVGTNPSNYICFGTTDKNACLNDTDKYMYRIIGIFEDSEGNKHAKLIKKETLNAAYYAWNSDNTTDVDWNDSDLYKGLNGSYFLTNTSYPYMQDSTWTDKIATWNYTMTNTKTYENYNSNGTYGPYYLYNTGKTLYLHELNRSGKSSETCYYNSSTTADCNVGEWKTLSTKISLMYASDYALSLGSDALSYTGQSNENELGAGWMFIYHSSRGNQARYEWTMSRLGIRNSTNYAWIEHTRGFLNLDEVSTKFAVRPVFYLTSDVGFSSGTGTITDPFLITE